MNCMSCWYPITIITTTVQKELPVKLMIVIMLPTLVKTEELSPEKVNKNNRIFHNSFTKQH